MTFNNNKQEEDVCGGCAWKLQPDASQVTDNMIVRVTRLKCFLHSPMWAVENRWGKKRVSRRTAGLFDSETTA